MKVAYLLNVFPALSETFVLNEVLEMEALGVEVQVFARQPRQEEKRHEQLTLLRRPPVYVSPSRAQKADSLLRYGLRHPARLEKTRRLAHGKPHWQLTHAVHLARLVEAFGAERIHCHFATAAADFGLYVAALTGLPFSFTAHAYDIFFKPPDNFAELAAEADHVITISHYNEAYLREHYGIAAGKIAVIRCGIDGATFCPDGAKQAIDEKAVDDRSIDILSVGRLHPDKGFAHLIEACRLLRDRGLAFNCTVVGDGHLREELARRAAECGLAETITFAGALTQAEVRELLRRAKVFTLPSISEGIGVATMEALACEMPAVVTRVMGVPELVEDGVCGFLVPPGDAATLADRIERLLRDPELRQRLGAAGRRKVLRDFNLHTEVAKLKNLWLSQDQGIAA